MATRFYLHEASSLGAFNTTGPTVKQSAMGDDIPGQPADKGTAKAMHTPLGILEATRSFGVPAGATTDIVHVGTWLSPKLAAQTIAIGTVYKLSIACKYDLTDAGSATLRAFFYQWREGTGKVADLSTDQLVDVPLIAAGNQRWRQIAFTTVNPVTLAAGDQIACEVWASAVRDSASISNVHFWDDGSVDDYDTLGEGANATNSASWFESSQTITLYMIDEQGPPSTALKPANPIFNRRAPGAEKIASCLPLHHASGAAVTDVVGRSPFAASYNLSGTEGTHYSWELITSGRTLFFKPGNNSARLTLITSGTERTWASGSLLLRFSVKDVTLSQGLFTTWSAAGTNELSIYYSATSNSLIIILWRPAPVLQLNWTGIVLQDTVYLLEVWWDGNAFNATLGGRPPTSTSGTYNGLGVKMAAAGNMRLGFEAGIGTWARNVTIDYFAFWDGYLLTVPDRTRHIGDPWYSSRRVLPHMVLRQAMMTGFRRVVPVEIEADMEAH